MQERVEDELRVLSVLLSERLESFNFRSEEMQSRTDKRESAQIDKRQHWTKTWAAKTDTEISRDCARDCMCRGRWAPYHEDSSDIIEGDFECSEEEREESEAYASSTESSVYYPRHVMRIG